MRPLRTNLLEARSKEWSRYTGKPCVKHPQLAGLRYTCNSRCVGCAVEITSAHLKTQRGKATRTAYNRSPARKEKRAHFRARYNKSERGRARKVLWDTTYNAKHPGKRDARVASWYASHPGKHQLHRLNYKLRKAGARLSPRLPEKLATAQHGRCAACGSVLNGVFHLDHILPLVLGGKHQDDNIQLLCPPCNLIKNRKHPVDFMQSMGFLL